MFSQRASRAKPSLGRGASLNSDLQIKLKPNDDSQTTMSGFGTISRTGVERRFHGFTDFTD
jgi:hypothetical protein